MKKARLFIHTSKNEGFGLVLVESMVYGTPVVVFNCLTGSREILADGKYGALIPLGDEAAFIEKTYQLLNDENQRKNYIVYFDEAIARFSPTVIRSQLFNMIETVIALKYGRK